MPKSHVYAGRSPDHGSAHLYAPGGLGILGALVPTTGEGGRGGLLANDVISNGWQGSEVRLSIRSSNFQSLFVGDDSSWRADDLATGSFLATQAIYLDGVLQPGVAALSVIVGASASMNGAAPVSPLRMTGGFITGPAVVFSGNAPVAPLRLQGGFSVVYAGAPTSEPLENVRPSFDVVTTVWQAVGDSSIAASINETSPSDADYASKDTRLPGRFVVALGESLPAGRHVLRVKARVTNGVGGLSIRLLGADLEPVGVASPQAVTSSGLVYLIPLDASARASYLEIDGGQLKTTTPGEYQSDVIVSWVEIKTLAPYDGQSVGDT